MLFNFQEPQSDKLDDSEGFSNTTESDDIKTLEARLLEVKKENELLSLKEIQQVRLLQWSSNFGVYWNHSLIDESNF